MHNLQYALRYMQCNLTDAKCYVTIIISLNIGLCVVGFDLLCVLMHSLFDAIPKLLFNVILIFFMFLGIQWFREYMSTLSDRFEVYNGPFLFIWPFITTNWRRFSFPFALDTFQYFFNTSFLTLQVSCQQNVISGGS